MYLYLRGMFIFILRKETYFEREKNSVNGGYDKMKKISQNVNMLSQTILYHGSSAPQFGAWPCDLL